MGYHGIEFSDIFWWENKKKFQIFLFVILTLMEFFILFYGPKNFLFIFCGGIRRRDLELCIYSMSHEVTILLVLDLFCIFRGRVGSW